MVSTRVYTCIQYNTLDVTDTRATSDKGRKVGNQASAGYKPTVQMKKGASSQLINM